MPNEAFPKSEEGKLNIYFHISENSGVGYYRLFLPAIKLREKGLANVMISDFKWGEGNHVEPNVELLFEIMDWADVVVVGRKDEGNFYAQWGAIKEFFNIPIIMDSDDNVQHVRPSNPGYQGYHPGSEALVWNKYSVAKTFSALTVSTQDLYDFYKKQNPKIFVLPNNLDMKSWDSFEKRSWNDGLIRIGFIASASHLEGIRLIQDGLLKIMQKYPQVIFYITHIYYPFLKDFPVDIKGRIHPVPWIRLTEWPKGMKDLGLDIGLAPLADNLFNRAKSNLRWMEYGAQGVPAVVSSVKPYLCVKDGFDGLLARNKEDWYTQIEKLITDEVFRKTMGQIAYERVSMEFDIDKNISLWQNVYRDIHDKYHEFFGAKKRFTVIKQGKKKKYREIIHQKSLLR